MLGLEGLCGKRTTKSNKGDLYNTSILITLTNEKQTRNFIPQRKETTVLMTYRRSFVEFGENTYTAMLYHISVYSSIFCETEKKRARYRHETYALTKQDMTVPAVFLLHTRVISVLHVYINRKSRGSRAYALMCIIHAFPSQRPVELSTLLSQKW